ncbi:LptM family lipoprotein [Ruminococcus albus]|uniref:Uncharacterized protein n=1 Tax=Ruminococcus albus TaxID=1264 RepID=A0A1I1ITZ5_RUMAL|nr:hypothetical protein [Ruminococcus albus]SFC36700.1 hypothetical protein SAMN02910406_01615 [Ruminococcus albus]
MKKTYILAVAVMLAFGLSACGDKDAHKYKEPTSSKANTESKPEYFREPEDTSTTEEESSEAVTEDSDSSTESKTPAESKAEKRPEKTTSKPATDPDDGKSYVFDDPEGEVAVVQNDDGTITVAIPSNGITNEEANYSDHHIVKKEEVKSEENSDMTYLTFDEDYFNTVAQNNINSSKETLDDLIANGLDAYTTVTDITYNDDFTDFTIHVKSKEDFEKSADKEITAVIEQAASIYHTYSLHEDVTFTFRFVDADGNEFLKEMIAG